MLLATYRAEEVVQAHPLIPLIPLLVREAHAERIDLRPLDEAAIGTLVSDRYDLSGPDRTRLVHYLAGRTNGNALYVSELLRTLESERLLYPGLAEADRSKSWVLGDLATAPVPTLLRQVIAGRLARLPQEDQRLLAVAAIIGQEVPLDVWVSVGEIDEETLLDHIERAIATHLMVEAPDGTRARFVHALVREALYEGLPPTRRRRLHRRVGEAVEALSHPDPDIVAYHFRLADDPRAKAWLGRAGERAERVHAGLSAAARFEAVLGLLTEDETRAGERGWLLYRTAWLRRFMTPQGSIATLEAARLAALAEDRALASCIIFERGHLRCLTGDFGRGLPDMAAAAETLGDPAIIARIATRVNAAMALELTHSRDILARWYAHAGHFAAARALIAFLPADAPAAYRGHQARGLVAAGLGQPAEAREAFALARAASLDGDEYFQASIVARFELTWALLLWRPRRGQKARRCSFRPQRHAGPRSIQRASREATRPHRATRSSNCSCWKVPGPRRGR